MYQTSEVKPVFIYLVCVPVVWSRVDSLPLVSLQQLFSVPDTHRPSHDLTNVWHQHVDLQHRETYDTRGIQITHVLFFFW